MLKVGDTNLKQKILLWIGKETSFPVAMPCDPDQSSEIKDADIEIDSRTDHCCSGGYNEAFIFEHWASYGPRH